MIRGVPFFHGDKEPAARSTHLALCLQCEGDTNPVLEHLCWCGVDRQGCTVRCRAP